MITAPSACRQLVGAALRRYREDLALSLTDAARILECDKSKISRIETGHRGITPRELRELLAGYGVTGPAMTTLATLTSRVRCWPQYQRVIPAPFRDALALELAASQIWLYNPQQIPDLLQTPDYTRALLPADPTIPPDHHDDLIALTQARSDAILSQHHRTIIALIGQDALYESAATDAAMAAQRRHLASIGDKHPHITIQILPPGSDTRVGGAGPLTIYQFPGDVTAVHLSGLHGGTTLTSDSGTAQSTKAFLHLQAAALTPDAARRLLTRPPRACSLFAQNGEFHPRLPLTSDQSATVD